MEFHVKIVCARWHQFDMASHVKLIYTKTRRNAAFDMERALMELTCNSMSNQASDPIETGFHVKRDVVSTVWHEIPCQTLLKILQAAFDMESHVNR